jgi:acyl homoserine lactone synthase
MAFERKKERTMLKLIEGSYASFFPKETDAMFRNRAETFSDRLGWEVTVKDGYERDIFDDENPLYLVSVDPDTEKYWGSLRLLPTTGPNMLRDVFPQLLDGDYIESATIWESSRICAAAVAGQPERSRSRVNYVLSELILGIGEVAVAAGLTQIVSVFDARMFRVLKAAGCNLEIIGTPQRIGGVMCYAGWRGAAAGVSRRGGNPALGSGSRRERNCLRLNGGLARGARSDRTLSRNWLSRYCWFCVTTVK